MDGLEEKTLRDSDVLTCILFGLGAGRHRDLKKRFVEVLYDEEHPDEDSEEKVHPLFEGRYFTTRSGGSTKTFEVEWVRLVQYQWVESIGFEGDYYANVSPFDARDFKEIKGISQEDYDYLTGLREKFDKKLW